MAQRYFVHLGIFNDESLEDVASVIAYGTALSEVCFYQAWALRELGFAGMSEYTEHWPCSGEIVSILIGLASDINDYRLSD